MKLAPYPEYKESGVPLLGHIPWLVVLPEHWSVVRSKRLFATRKERARSDDEQLSATQAYGVIPQKEFERLVGRKVVRINQHLEKRAHVEPDDFVISMRSFQGGLERAWGRGCIRSSYVVLNPSPQAKTGYYAHLFKCVDYIRALQATSNFIRDGQDLNYGNFCLVDLPRPPADEQSQIARFLDWKTAQINKFIRNKRRLIELLKEQKQNVINQAVTRGLDPNVKLKSSGVEWVGDIPEHWDTVPLRHLAICLDGERVPLEASARGRMQGPYPYWGANQVIDHLNDYLFDEDLILLGEDGAPFFDPYKPVAFLSKGKVWPNNHIHVLRPRKGNSPEIIVHALNCADYTSFVGGATRDKLTQNYMKAIPIPLPPLKEQDAIVSHIEGEITTIDRAITRAQREIELMREYRTRLISDVVTGQVDVRGIEVPALEEEIGSFGLEDKEEFTGDEMVEEDGVELVGKLADGDE